MFAGLSALSGAMTLAAEESQAGQTVLRGEIMDPAMYLRDGRHGPETTDQTYAAVDGGQTLALLTTEGDVYLFLAEEPGEDPNELAYDYVTQQVNVTGRVYQKAGMFGIVPTLIQPINPTASPRSEDTPSPASN